MKRVLILSDCRPGHFNQSLAVAEAMKQLDEVEVKYIEVKIKKFGIYGSFADGTNENESDIDLWIKTNKKETISK